MQATGLPPYFSTASLWEITIKHSLGKLDFGLTLPELFWRIQQTNLQEQYIMEEHLLQLHGLPFHHRDPFDRLLIAPAITENLTFLTKDGALRAYPVSWLW